MYSRTINIKNGDTFTKYDYYECDSCGTEIGCSDYFYEKDGLHYCNDCAFKKELFDEKTYLNSIGFDDELFNAGIKPSTGEINVIIGNKFNWELKNKDFRNSDIYLKWRSKVFKRDDYTCQECGKIGGILNAHHIKKFSDYLKLRTKVSNGKTLCKECHLKHHKKFGF